MAKKNPHPVTTWLPGSYVAPAEPTTRKGTKKKKKEPAGLHPIDKQWFVSKFYDTKRSQNEIAAMVGLDKSSLSRTLKGERKMTGEEVKKIARVLGLPQEEVFAHAFLGKVKTMHESITPELSTRSILSLDEPRLPIGGLIDAVTGEVAFNTASDDYEVMALRVVGDPTWAKVGVAYLPETATRPEDAATDVGLLRLAGGRWILGKFVATPRAGRFNLEPVLGFGSFIRDVEVCEVVYIAGLEGL